MFPDPPGFRFGVVSPSPPPPPPDPPFPPGELGNTGYKAFPPKPPPAEVIVVKPEPDIELSLPDVDKEPLLATPPSPTVIVITVPTSEN